MSLGIRPPQHRFYSCLHLFHAQRLGNIIVGTDVKPLDRVVFVVESCDEDNGDLRRCWVFLNLSRHLESWHFAHHHIQENQSIFLQRKFECLFRRIGCHDLISLGFKVKLQNLAEIQLVIDNKNLHKFIGLVSFRKSTNRAQRYSFSLKPQDDDVTMLLQFQHRVWQGWFIRRPKDSSLYPAKSLIRFSSSMTVFFSAQKYGKKVPDVPCGCHWRSVT